MSVKKGVLLVNMGGAESPEQLRSFLYNMFMDKHIINTHLFIRNLVAFIISRRRYKKAWKKYELINGSPLLEAGKEIAAELNKSINLPVVIAYSYSSPKISEGVLQLKKQGINSITVIPLYPQASYTTTSSVQYDINRVKEHNISFKFVKDFYKTKEFIEYWANLIQKHISDNQLKKPLLVFTAHSIPMSVVKKGDTYIEAIQENAKLISKELELDFLLSFQSKFGPVAWYGEDSKDIILRAITEGCTEIIVVPISFISECLETIYDIDIDLFPELKPLISDKIKLTRITIPYAHPLLIKTLKSLV